MNLLFNETVIAGLKYEGELIGSDEAQRLIEHLLQLELAPFRFHGWVGNRKTQSFGWRYDFDDSTFSRGEPIPLWLQSLRETAAAFAGIRSEDFVQVLIARYDPDAGIGWHRDRDVFDEVVGISLASPATLRFRRRRPGGFDRARLELAPRSAYPLSGEVRRDWEHSIAPGNKLRFSITFRTLSEKGLDRAARQ